MKTKQTTNLTNYVNVLTIFAFVIFTIFQFLQSSDFEKLIMIDFRMIFAGGIYCIIGMWLFTRISTIPLGILAMAAGGFLLYAYFYYFNFGSFALENANPYMISFALLTALGIIFGIKLHQRNEEMDRMGSSFLLSLSAVLLTIIICDYFLPKPAKIDYSGVMATIITAFFVIAGSIAVHAFKASGMKNPWIPVIIYRFVSIGGIFFLILSLNNVIYNGCYPSAPIGCPCNLQKQEIMPIVVPDLKKDTTVSQPSKPSLIVSENVVTPKGGSLCGTLGMTGDEALHFAKENGMKYWWKKGMLYVLIFPGDQFHKVDGKWELM